MFEFKRLQMEHLQIVLDWRTKPRVTDQMLTDVPYSLAKQIDWFKKHIMNNPLAHYWIIFLGEIPIGVINIAGLDLEKKRCSYGYYIGDDSHRVLGGFIPLYFYNYLFKNFQIDAIDIEVLETNKRVLEMHRRHGLEELPDRAFNFKRGRSCGIICFVLTRENWENQKKKYAKYQAEFEREAI